jgi:ribonucleotide monophosphatase NagD (HAD superfamily)
MLSLKHTMENAFGITPKFTQFGKPAMVTFEYAHDLLMQKAKDENAEISHFYMIGDNPSGDILGANLMQYARNQKWSSILVQTGLYHPDNYGHHREKLEGLTKPTYEVKDMHDAI